MTFATMCMTVLAVRRAFEGDLNTAFLCSCLALFSLALARKGGEI